MPDPAVMLAGAFERVLIEEGLAVERQPGQRAIVERDFHDVGEASVGAAAEHAVRPEHQADRRAGLRIGALVGQIVVVGKALVGCRGSDAAGDVHLLGDEVVPERFEGLGQRVVAVLGGDVRHSRIEIHGAHGMPDDLLLVANRLMRLVVVVGPEDEILRIAAVALSLDVEIVGFGATLVDEILGQVHVLLLAGGAGELDQCQLDFFMSAIAGDLVRTMAELVDDVVDIAAHDVHQLALSGGLIVGDRAFDQVPGAIKLMRVAKVGPLAARHHAQVPGIEIAVLALQLAIEIDDGVDARLELGVGLAVERVGHRLDRFSQVAVPEHLGRDHGLMLGGRHSRAHRVVGNDDAGAGLVDVDRLQHARLDAAVQQGFGRRLADGILTGAEQTAEHDGWHGDGAELTVSLGLGHHRYSSEGRCHFTAPAIRPRM